MPWMVAMFGVLVIPLGIASIVLVILQPVMVGEWCTLCLATAALMLMMIPLAVDEVAAMLQFLSAAVREGQPLWRTFWIGGTLQMHDHPSTIAAKDRDSPGRGSVGHGADTHRSLAESVRAMVRGVTAPWNLLAVAVLGLWVMAAPDAIGASGRLATSSHIAGAVATTVAVVALAEVVRVVRLVNVVIGLWIVMAPWVLGGTTPGARWTGTIAGLLIALLALRQGAIRERSRIAIR